MIGNLTGKQIAIIVIAVILLLWFINWLFFSRKKTTIVNITPYPANLPQMEHMQPMQAMRQMHQMHQMHPITTPIGPEIHQEDAPFILYYFFSPSCSHCKRFTPNWQQASEKLKAIKGLSLRTVDSTKAENENLTFYYNITAFPTVILVTPDKNMEYTGNRSPDDLYNFAATNLSQYRQ